MELRFLWQLCRAHGRLLTVTTVEAAALGEGDTCGLRK
jgi:hypothetical protein